MFDLSTKFHLNESNGPRDIASQTNRQTDRQRNCKIVEYKKFGNHFVRSKISKGVTLTISIREKVTERRT